MNASLWLVKAAVTVWVSNIVQAHGKGPEDHTFVSRNILDPPCTMGIPLQQDLWIIFTSEWDVDVRAQRP